MPLLEIGSAAGGRDRCRRHASETETETRQACTAQAGREDLDLQHGATVPADERGVIRESSRGAASSEAFLDDVPRRCLAAINAGARLELPPCWLLLSQSHTHHSMVTCCCCAVGFVCWPWLATPLITYKISCVQCVRVLFFGRAFVCLLLDEFPVLIIIRYWSL